MSKDNLTTTTFTTTIPAEKDRSKNVLVIGGTSGYGAGIVNTLKATGYNVISSGRSSKSFPCDVTSADSVNNLFQQIKGMGITLDVVVYSAGKAIGKKRVSEKDTADFENVFQVNTLGLLSFAKYAYKHLIVSQGHFLHVGSIAHELNYVGGADYCASKAASNTIMRTLRHEWLGTGIRTTSLEVGLGDTNFQKNRYKGDTDQANKHFGAIKQLDPSDLGDMVNFILLAPNHVNVDEVVMKPLDQATHGMAIDILDIQF